MKAGFFRNAAWVTVALAGGATGLYLFFRFALPVLTPFLFALLLAVLTRPLVRKISACLGGHEKLSAAGVTLFFLCLVGVLCYFLVLLLVTQAQNLLEMLLRDAADENGKLAAVLAFFRGTAARLPLFSRLSESALFRELIGDPETFLKGLLQKSLTAWAEKIPPKLTVWLARLPAAFVAFLVGLIACFFFALDYPRVTAFLRGLCPPRLREKLPEAKRRVGEVFRRWLGAYFLLFLLTFGELFLGLLLLRERYAFLLAFLIALMDILPVLGVGTALLPWAIFRLLGGNTWGGVGLILLYAVITVVRQITEPHLVGKSIGLHPLVTLFAFFAGMKLFGFAGIFLGPIAALLIKAIFFAEKPAPAP